MGPSLTNTSLLTPQSRGEQSKSSPFKLQPNGWRAIRNPWASYKIGLSLTPNVPSNPPKQDGKVRLSHLSQRLKADEIVNGAHFRIHWLVVKWYSEQSCSFCQSLQLAMITLYNIWTNNPKWSCPRLKTKPVRQKYQLLVLDHHLGYLIWFSFFSVEINFVQMLPPKNVDLAIEILFLSYLEAKI